MKGHREGDSFAAELPFESPPGLWAIILLQLLTQDRQKLFDLQNTKMHTGSFHEFHIQLKSVTTYPIEF